MKKGPLWLFGVYVGDEKLPSHFLSNQDSNGK